MTFRFAPRRVRGGHVTFCFAPRKRAKEVTRCSVSRAKEAHVGSDIRECEEVENGVRPTANEKIILPQCV
ncbi:hypothetical protein chiPu_0014531 [Chiloscyllium punctatum]|uniref:Uncharacterized protein n=1 Tax=Chiloscyllium punctatum TaxID=137246 RepID=A0A401T075_CHIPU|nr:hypothetical protein [Chiloscyllium punctatum]